MGGGSLENTNITATVQKSSTFWKDSFRRLMKDKRAVWSFATIILLVLSAIFAPLLSPHDPNDVFFDAILVGSSMRFPFGTDHIGRCLLSRVIHGGRISLAIGVITQFISVPIGIIIGAIAGYFGKFVDMVLSRFMDVMLAFPSLIFSLAILAILGPGLFNLYIALGLLGWVGTARLVRGQIMQLKELEYIEAARASGASAYWNITKHLIPNCLPMIIISVSLGIPNTIMAEVALSFIGLGVQPPIASWGSMINQARPFIRQMPMFSLYPGIAVMLVVFSFNMFGDCLRDVLDPRLKDER